MSKNYISAGDELVAKLEERWEKLVKIGRELSFSCEFPDELIRSQKVNMRSIIGAEVIEYLLKNGNYHHIRYFERELENPYHDGIRRFEMMALIFPDPTEFIVEKES